MSLRLAEQGRQVVQRIKEIEDLGEDTGWVILATEDEALCRSAAWKILPEYMQTKYLSRVAVLERSRPGVKAHIYRTDGREVLFLPVPKEELEAVLTYYRLVPFAQDVIVVSLAEPFACPGWIGRFGITAEQYVRDALFFGTPVSWMWWNAADSIRAAVQNAGEELRNRRIFLYGWTRYAGDICSALTENGLTVSGLVDSSPEKDGWEPIPGLRCTLPEKALYPRDDDTVVVIVSKYAREMRGRLASLGYGKAQILELPVSGNTGSSLDISRETLEREFQTVCRGVEVRRNLPEGKLIPSLGGTGDVYWLCSLLNGYLRSTGINEYTLLLEDKKGLDSYRRVAALFGVRQVEARPLEEMTALFKAWEFLGSDRLEMKPDLHLGSRLVRNIRPNRQNGHFPPWRNHLNSMLCQYFYYPGARPAEPFRRTVSFNSWLRLGLHPGRTVVLSPYAAAFQSTLVRGEFWPQLAAELRERGYDTATNCAKNEQPIPGTIPVCPDYENLIGLLNCAGGFIAMRSGLCDIASSARNCRMVLLYEQGTGIIPDTFSLLRMGVHPQAKDLVFTGDTAALIDKILAVFPPLLPGDHNVCDPLLTDEDE